MRWSYKTVHFGLKKDGLLGGAFLDDAEIEETLNEYGQGGWELISMFETRDGVIAVFKQPLDLDYERRATLDAALEKSGARPVSRYSPVEPEPEEEPEPVPPVFREKKGYPVARSTYPSSSLEDEDDAEVEDSDSGIGAIRIE